jgi:hypothetical protein
VHLDGIVIIVDIVDLVRCQDMMKKLVEDTVGVTLEMVLYKVCLG